MENLEQQCEDAVFELCDARERFPSYCADELKKCIQIRSVINMSQVLHKPTVIDKSPTLKKEECLNFDINEDEISFDHLDSRLENVISTLDNLKVVMDQIVRERQCSTNKLLED